MPTAPDTAPRIEGAPDRFPADSILCPATRCWHPINQHIVEQGGCRVRTNSGQTLCQCKRTPNDVAAAVLANVRNQIVDTDVVDQVLGGRA